MKQRQRGSAEVVEQERGRKSRIGRPLLGAGRNAWRLAGAWPYAAAAADCSRLPGLPFLRQISHLAFPILHLSIVCSVSISPSLFSYTLSFVCLQRQSHLPCALSGPTPTLAPLPLPPCIPSPFRRASSLHQPPVMFNILRAALLFSLVALSSASSTARNPLRRLATVESPRIHTQSRRVHAYSSFDLTFDVYGGSRTVKLSLEPNHDVLPEGATISYLDADGSLRHQEPLVLSDHKVYRGKSFVKELDGSWSPVGWARVSVFRDGVRPLFEGAFGVHHDSHHVQLSSTYMSSRHAFDPDVEFEPEDYMVMWRDSDVAQDSLDSMYKRDMPGRSCGSDDLEFNNDPSHPVIQDILRRNEKSYLGSMPIEGLFGKRQIDSVPGTSGNGAGVNLVSTIGQTAGCPNTKKVALVGVATDCTYTSQFNSTESVRQNIIQQMSAASRVWEDTFNITLGLQNLTISDHTCPGTPPNATPWNQPCENGPDITARLNLFSGWRGSLSDTNSHWTLLTNCNTGSAVGLAWLGQACVHNSQTAPSSNSSGQQETVSGANVVAKTSTEWQVIAHETGHTYGAVHDCTSQTCADANFVRSQQCCQLSSGQCDAGQQYIMNPSAVDGITHFSPCTIGNICSAIGRSSVNTGCLTANKGVVTISGQQCGNGIVEAGEDCDCGGPQGCGNNSCCDATTCKFKNNAVCDDSNEECCHSCQFAPSTQICRASSGQCDPEERCTGNTPVCPSDVKAPDGQSCSLPANATMQNVGSLACASGQCTSRDLQCRTVMGAYTQNSNDTYACDSSTCRMSCASNAFGPGVCYGVQQNLLDGTPCGGGGKCSNGQCSGSTTAGEIRSWIQDHLALVIGLAAGIGGLLLLSFLCCLISCCRRRSALKRHAKRAPTMPVSPTPLMTPAGGGYYGPAPPSGRGSGASAMQERPSQSQAGWEQQAGWYPPPPGQPPPMYHGGGYGGWQSQSGMRYA